MADTIPGNSTSLNTLAVNTWNTSSVDFLGDSDWWKVSLTTGYAYFVNLQGRDTTAGTLVDPWLAIYNSDSALLTYDDDSGYGRNAYIYFTPTATGAYFLAAEVSGNNALGTYAISIANDLLASSTTAARIEVGASGVSSIDLDGDTDWVGTNLVAGHTYVFDLKGSNTTSGTLTDPSLVIADSSGNYLAVDDNLGVGLNSQIVYNATTSAIYYLIASEANNSAIGTYTIEARDLSSLATALATNSSTTGILQNAGETDFYSISATVGSLLTITVDVPAGLSGFPYEIQVLDSTGPLITRWITGQDLHFTVAASQGGNGYIKVMPGTTYSSEEYGITLTSESLDYSTVPTSTIRPLTGDDVVDATTHGYYWALNEPRIVTWAIAANSTAYWIDVQGALTGIQDIFKHFEAVANIHFKGLGYYSSVEAATALGADIVLTLDGANKYFSSSLAWARGFFPSTEAAYNPYPGAAGDVWININSSANALSYTPGAAGYFLLLHELGHALGLKHPHDDGGTQHPTYDQAGIKSLDIDFATVMSYNDDFNWNLREWDPATLMPLDVVGLQSLYGANDNENSEDNTYSLVANNYYQTIWDSAGVDSVSAAGSSEGWVISLPSIQLATSSSVLTGVALFASEYELSSPTTLYWLMGDIENAIGSGHDDFIGGNDLANAIDGGRGNDFMSGGGGDDIFDWNADSREGSDTMSGGEGDDQYVIDSLSDVVTELPNEGTDLIWSSIAYSIEDIANVENLTLFGIQSVNGTGNALDNVIVGNAETNILEGLGGADTLIGGTGDDTLRGGEGDDSLSGGDGNNYLDGGPGNDTLTGGNGLDTIFGGDGDDYIYSRYSNMEAGSDDGANYIDGGSGSDIITGGNADDSIEGGQGEDLLYGGNGNDTLRGGDDSDYIVGNGGNDSIEGGLGDDFLFGSDGVDSAIFSGALSEYTMVSTATGWRLTGPDGIDEMSGIEFAIFADQSKYLNNSAPTGSITISGSTTQGQTLTALNTLADIDGLGTIGYQWKTGDEDIAGATTSTLLLAEAHVGKSISVVASYTDGHGTTESIVSSATSTVVNVNDVPAGSVAIEGTVIQGHTLSVSNTLTDADGVGSISYQWLADGINMIGANADIFTLTEAEVEKIISVTASYTDGHNMAESVSSNETKPVANLNDIPTGDVTIRGVPAQGYWLTAGSTLADIDGLGQISYQWNIDETIIDDAVDNRFVLTEAQVGKNITVTAKYADGHGTIETVTSSAVLVTALPIGQTIEFIAYSWSSHTVLSDVSITYDTMPMAETDSQGNATVIGITDSSLTLDIARDVPSIDVVLTDQAVNLQDAIAILKMIVGLDVNGPLRPLSPYQAYAADFDGSGAVTLTDAIGVLKHVVGLDSPNPQWLFFNEADTRVPGKANLTPGTVPTTINVDLTVATPEMHVGLVGVLRGDVDGSHTGATNSQDLDDALPNYFQNLASTSGLDLSQFGIYV